MKTACFVYASGCPRNRVDMARLFEYFRLNGWRLVPRTTDADLVLVSVCGVDAHCEHVGLRHLDVVNHRRKEDSQLIVLGCLASMIEDKLSSEYHATLLPPKELDRLDEMIGATVPLKNVAAPNIVEPYIDRARHSLEPLDRFRLTAGKERRQLLARTRQKAVAWVRGSSALRESGDSVFTIKVAAGCMGRCTYCAIKFGAGPLVSRPLAEIEREFLQGLALGHGDFHIVAGDIGAYGQDIGLNFVDLLKCLLNPDTHAQLTLIDVGPAWLVHYADAVIPLLTQHADRFRLIMLPVQSGSDGVLGRMQRDYRASEVARAMKILRGAAPNLPLGTHVLVGFPGETDTEFQETLDFLEETAFDRVDVYRYSDRPKTEASVFPDKVPDWMARRRAERLCRQFGAHLEAV